MKIKLVVVKPFEGFRRGDTITDAAKIDAVLASAQAGSVVRVVAEG
ncbi:MULTISPECIES: hypothetical protein [Acidiphilium]|jgi:hypothetical protein|uniref:Uncharacterized protein n=1 Tax=Acidiphilium multivorum (strain DSM 11245 / JCM 8867 / NBRC 100883 / AIU 301) TaxID=926570 RepID=F0J441_ACIMA|nr:MULTISPECIES: hypothetical protein [Acidiphilium]MBU6357458.1 hypothetical protein [Rhodospirillales bacterium]KDM66583.1 hypothetical protein ACIDI_59c00600 [Acidiphilium sp. JA12-A1]MBS3022984.1 hypothetical protein [Acidiphilium multivorum]BAJ82182.1 hypothetical protein ACMV_28350 [Acidiphilium multivorum AIU301]GAN72754.1 hypothetical protein Apmu_0025_10 [Acidiphilium multivorum AIU301]